MNPISNEKKSIDKRCGVNDMSDVFVDYYNFTPDHSVTTDPVTALVSEFKTQVSEDNPDSVKELIEKHKVIKNKEPWVRFIMKINSFNERKEIASDLDKMIRDIRLGSMSSSLNHSNSGRVLFCRYLLRHLNRNMIVSKYMIKDTDTLASTVDQDSPELNEQDLTIDQLKKLEDNTQSYDFDSKRVKEEEEKKRQNEKEDKESLTNLRQKAADGELNADEESQFENIRQRADSEEELGELLRDSSIDVDELEENGQI
jgi:hypothetical protein